MSFKKLQIEDKQKYEAFFKNNDRMGCEYTFACNFIWQDVFHASFDVINGAYVSKTARENENVYNFPIGEEKDIISAMNYILELEKEKTVFRGILKQHIDFINENFPGKFSFSSNRDEFDYVYLSEKLINLSGKKYQSKRNLINRFCDNSEWVYEEISRDNVNECIALNLKWSDERDASNIEIRKELGAANTALSHFEELGLIGGLIRLNGKVIAYSMGEKLTDDTFVIHFEKADDSIKGAYQIINNEFAKRNCKEYKYINREEDNGEEGLRKAKLSYKPEMLIEKFEARINA